MSVTAWVFSTLFYIVLLYAVWEIRERLRFPRWLAWTVSGVLLGALVWLGLHPPDMLRYPEGWSILQPL